MFSQKKLNTYGVESPCGRWPGVGSFLANPGLSKEQLVPSCVVRTFILRNSSIEIPAWHLWWYVVTTYKIVNTSIGILAWHLRPCVVVTFIMIDVSVGILVQHLRRCHLTEYKVCNYCMKIILLMLCFSSWITIKSWCVIMQSAMQCSSHSPSFCLYQWNEKYSLQGNVMTL